MLNTSTVLLVISMLSAIRLGGCLSLTRRLNLSTVIRARSNSRVEGTVVINTRVVNIGGEGLGSFAMSVSGDVGLHEYMDNSMIFVSRDNVGAGRSIAGLGRGGISTILVNRALVGDSSGGTVVLRLGGNWGWGL